MVIFHSYLSLPEGIEPPLFALYCLIIGAGSRRRPVVLIQLWGLQWGRFISRSFLTAMSTQNLWEALRVISMELQELIEELNFCPNGSKSDS